VQNDGDTLQDRSGCRTSTVQLQLFELVKFAPRPEE
jgi:hypothetical protein